MRPLRAVAHAHVHGLVFVFALAVGVFFNLGALPVARQVIRLRINRVLSPLFVGKITIDRIGSLGFHGIAGLDAHVDDGDGKRVIDMHDAEARVSTEALVRSLFEVRGPLDIAIPELTITRAEVHLDTDATGDLRIARTFALRTPSSVTPGDRDAPGRDARIALRSIHIVHALLLAQPSFANDADLDDADGALSFSPQGLAIDLSRSHLAVRGLPENADAKGAVEAHLTKPDAGALSLRASWQGAVGAIASHATVTIDGAKVDASVDAGPATPEQARGLWPAWPVAVPLGVHAEAHGTLPRLVGWARASAGAGNAGDITIEGPVIFGPTVTAAIHVQADALSGTWLSPPLPFVDASGSGDVTLSVSSNGATRVQTVFTLDGAEWSDVAIPSTTLTADVTHGPDGPTTLQANLAIREPGAPASVSLRLAATGGKTRLSFDATAAAPRLEAVALLHDLHGAVTGAATVRATGSIDVDAGTLAVTATGATDGLRAGPMAAGHTRVEVGATGTLRSPSLRVAIDGEELEAGPLHAGSFRADATAFPSAAGLALRDIDVDLRNQGPSLHVQAAGLRADAKGVVIDDAVILGLGAPLGASFAKSQSAVTVHAEGAGVDLARVASFLPTPVESGIVAIDVDATVERNAAVGHGKLDVTSAEIAGLRGTTAHVDVRVHGREIAGHATASAPDLGQLQIDSSSLEVGPGNLVTAEPWRRAWGAVDITADVDLAKALARIASLSPHRPVTSSEGPLRWAGAVRAGLRLERDSPSDVTPEVELTVGTTALAITGGDAKAPWRIVGVDPRLHARVDGQTGATSLAAELNDGGGTLVALDATSAAVPYAAVFSSASAEDVLGALRRMPFAAHVEIPARPVASLPPVLGTEGIRGALSAKVDWHGSVEKPKVLAVATLARGPSDTKAVALPLDFALSARYDGAVGNVFLTGSRRGNALLHATGTVKASAPDLVDGFGTGVFPWTAAAQVKLQKVPLRNVQMLDDRQVQGTVSGEITVADLHDDAHANATLSFDGLQVGDATCRSAVVTASADGKTFDAALRIDDANGGHLGVSAHSGLHWGRALVPAVDVAQPAKAAIAAQRFRAALLLPFVAGSFTELDGTIDGDARIAIDPSRETVTPEGALRLKDGAFELTSMGGEFHGVQAALALSPDGVVRLENAVAYGTSGQVQASATARLNGMSWSAARATVQMPRADPIPLVFDGVLLGQLDGRFDVALARTPSGMDVDLQVPSMHVALPAGAASRDVQSLGGIEGVSIGLDRNGEFVDIPLDGATPQPTASGVTPFTTKIALHLGNDVQVARGTDLDVHLAGQPSITIGSDVRVTGQIRLTRGSLDVKGKDFAIQQGTVTFTGDDPSNPQVVLTASWPAPDGTVIYADFVGPLKTGRVTLRSEPMRPQNEIFALLLFGTVEGSPDSGQGATDVNVQANGGSNNQSAVVGAQAGGAVATAPINQALGGLNRTLDRLGLTGGVSTKIDTSTANPRPEVEFQIARDISLQVGYVLGVPPVTNPDTTLVTLNWNFLRKWSLEATYGDQGSSILDVVWQHRY